MKMLEQIPSLPIIFPLILFIFMLIKLWQKKNHNSIRPPGPRKYPFIGNLPQLLGAPVHQRLADLAKTYGPVMSIQQGQIPSVVLSSVETAKEVLKIQGEEFAGRPSTMALDITFYDAQDIAYTEYGDYWRQMKKISTLEFLSAKRVHSFKPVREERISIFLDSLRSKGRSPVNLTRTIYGLTNSIIQITAFGKNCKTREKLNLDKIREAVVDGTIADLFPRFKFIASLSGAKSRMMRAHKEIDVVLDEILEEHKANKSTIGNNLMQVLLDFQKNGGLQVPLTTDQIKANMLEMFLSGSHTSSKITEWTMAELMRAPETMRKAQEEVRRVFSEIGRVDESRIHECKYVKNVLKEAFRLHPPGPMVVRQCREITKVNGYEILPGTTVFINVWAIGRDPEVWTEPEKFNPDRFEDSEIDYRGAHMELIPFGAGKRICPGLTLAVVYVELLLANLLYHFDWEFPDGVTQKTLDMTEFFRGTLNRKEDLYLIPVPSSSLPKN
ncbi:cytochrome P450 family 71 subfamily B polypeptide 2 [Euphorbia peplus]|uniref:4,5,8-trihydroxycasbene synthase n=1 Tax=Euphorbia peplus TaxID=38846 RepID=A0A088FMV8_EUPPE|nr:CYP726A6 [Euphorbia peplus]URX65626.1 putative cytochrome P450 monooxygenase [Euphorbia peplus]WCJ37103.1 cytochrome P450 family 71 subfamily B polypeptide 2 [Euphorbia peplus]